MHRTREHSWPDPVTMAETRLTMAGLDLPRAIMDGMMGGAGSYPISTA